jgi:penicillin-insensitive murein endopeptidase
MAYGHRSHQIGLDADIWFRYVPSGQTLSRRETEALPMRSVVSAAKARVEPERWSPALRDLLRAAAASPEVERIFVNPIIKQFLCRGESDRAWLRKIRPWWGHDAHFHVRLRCPLDSPLCQEQKPVPRGDGCDKDLDKWVRELQQAALSPPPKQHKPSRKPVVLPVNCTAVLQHDGDPRRPVGLDVRR